MKNEKESADHTSHNKPTSILLTKTRCDYLFGWVNKTVTLANISPEMVNLRDLAGNAAEGEEEMTPAQPILVSLLITFITVLTRQASCRVAV